MCSLISAAASLTGLLAFLRTDAADERAARAVKAEVIRITSAQPCHRTDV